MDYQFYQQVNLKFANAILKTIQDDNDIIWLYTPSGLIRYDGELFNKICQENNISGINGHRSVGGYRASIYNALSTDSINLLIKCMKEFESNYN